MLNFIADFYCHELDLVIEVDGDYHLHPDAHDYDNYRAERLREFGIRFLRFTDDQVQRNIEFVASQITEWIKSSNFPPLPRHIPKRRKPAS